MTLQYTAAQTKEAFNKAVLALPHLTKNAKPLSRGMFGLVMQRDDNVITKLIFRPDNSEWLRLAETHMKNEVNALRLFAEHPLEGVPTPVLIDDPVMLKDRDYMGYYHMSRLPGVPMWHYYRPQGVDVNADWLEAQSVKTGRMLARYHKAVLDTPCDCLMLCESNTKNGKISQVISLSGKMNRALAKADDYLQDHKIAGVIQGDFHGGNILVDQKQDIVGIIDFGFASRSQSIFYDFLYAEESFLPGLADGSFLPGLIHGYELQSGCAVDRHTITASALARWVSRLIKTEEQVREEKVPVEKTLPAIAKITGYLNDLSPVTGLRF